jgi:hypothetical protein
VNCFTITRTKNGNLIISHEAGVYFGSTPVNFSSEWFFSNCGTSLPSKVFYASQNAECGICGEKWDFSHDCRNNTNET